MRKPKLQVVEEYHKILRFPEILSMLNALPNVGMLLNDERQVVYANTVLLQSLGIQNIQQIVGMRPGEVIQCVNAHSGSDGCGSGAECRFCQAVQVVFACMDQRRKVSSECRVMSKVGDDYLPNDIRVTASPFDLNGDGYILVFFEDISAIKRLEQLNRIFFHDIMNTVGGLSTSLSCFTASDNSDDKMLYAELMELQVRRVSDELQAHRDLMLAENNSLEVALAPLQVSEVIEQIHVVLDGFFRIHEVSLVVEDSSNDATVLSDLALLLRVLTNLLKNACEASAPGQEVVLRCEQSTGNLVFTVQNDKVMTESIIAQVFQRSFSTKGKGRGLGTYSARLITTRYLKGGIDMRSSMDTGTEFIVKIPLEQGR